MISSTIALSTAVTIAERRAGRPDSAIRSGRARTLIERNALALRTSNAVSFLTGFIEPVIFLLAFGYGVGALVGTIAVDGTPLPYVVYVAPALLAASAMNGAIFDSTFNVFFKMHYLRVYQAMTSTSLGPLDVALGEIGWAMIRGAAYSVGFLAVVWAFGLIVSWWALALIPVAILIAFAFAAVGMSLTAHMSTFHQLNWLQFVMLPLFLFSGTFFPITAYPEWMQAIVSVTPLWQAVALSRDLFLGSLHPGLLVHVGYLLAMALIGLAVTTRRLDRLFLR
jgi:lipooligosaccharide transport system permease protein